MGVTGKVVGKVSDVMMFVLMMIDDDGWCCVLAHVVSLCAPQWPALGRFSLLPAFPLALVRLLCSQSQH